MPTYQVTYTQQVEAADEDAARAQVTADILDRAAARERKLSEACEIARKQERAKYGIPSDTPVTVTRWEESKPVRSEFPESPEPSLPLYLQGTYEDALKLKGCPR